MTDYHTKFEVGDRVRRTKWSYRDMGVGDEDVVTRVKETSVTLRRYGSGHSGDALEVVKRGRRGPFKPGIDGEVNEAERRSAQLRSLRSLANKLGYTLVKNDQEVTV